MNLDYEKIRAKVEHGGNHWTSYSDLFLVLSVVFLLLYVVANLRSGTVSIATVSQLQTAKAENEELRKQIKAYEVLKQDYLDKGASQDEVKMYEELMNKLTLLEDQADKERKELYKKAKLAEQKESELNRYQQMIKNIINANMVAQSKLKNRDQTIAQRDQEITQREKDIDDLNRQIQGKQGEIEENNRKIAEIQDKLQEQIQEVKYAYRSKQHAKEKLQAAIEKLQDDSARKIRSLRDANEQYMSQLESAQASIEEKNRKAEQLLSTLAEQEQKYKDAIRELDQAHKESLEREKSAFENGLQKGSLSADAKLAQERAYRESVEKQNETYNQKLQGLNSELSQTRQSIKEIEGKYQGSLKSLENANSALQKSLQASIAKLNAQKELAERIKQNFRHSGIDADVDMRTGDVLINFANEYFDTGRADLKNGMKSIIEKMMPVYARSLFQDQKVAKRIQSIEIVGFASPTYKGKYVNPDSLSPDDRTAVNYNMDLSYQRAKSIFEYIFDTSRMQFGHQKALLPLVKVTGRSYLATERLSGRGLASETDGEYCHQFDCKKSQRVIIKFNLRDE